MEDQPIHDIDTSVTAAMAKYKQKITDNIELANENLTKAQKALDNNKISYYQGIIHSCDKSLTLMKNIDFDVAMKEAIENGNACLTRDNFSKYKFWQGVHRGYLTCQQYHYDIFSQPQTTLDHNVSLQTIYDNIIKHQFESYGTALRVQAVPVSEIKRVFASHGVDTTENLPNF